MKITAVDTFVCPPQWTFVRIRTDEGITGWGEAGMQFRARAVQAAVHDLRGLLVGEDPTRIEAHWQVIRRSSFLRGGPILSSAQAAVDIALWDIVGKLHGVPIHELLGGPVRDRVRAYVWIAGDDLCDFSPEEIVAETMPWVEQGFTAFKLTPPKAYAVDLPSHGHAIVDRLTALREAIGPDRDIALDVHGHWSKTMARRMCAALEPLDLLFVEEPVLAENLHIVRELTQGTTPPDRDRRAPVLAVGVRRCRPVRRCRDPAGRLAGRRDLGAPAHRSDGRDVRRHRRPALPARPRDARCVASDRLRDAEHPDPGAGDHVLRGRLPPLRHEPRGVRLPRRSLEPTDGPGLGIEVDEEVVERMAEIGHDRKQPIWWHTDGSYAEF